MLIALTGKAGSGKDTVAQILHQEFGFERIAFATPIKDMLTALGYPEPPRELKEANYPGKTYSYRKLGQTLGTEWARVCIGENFWVDKMVDRLKVLTGDVVITDLRFENEYEAVKSFGATVVRVTGRQYDIGGVSGHASEAFSAPADDIIVNGGTIEELIAQVKRKVQKWRGYV